MTKIVGVSFGTKNGNNDTICKAVLLAAQKQGCEVEFIRAMDLDIKHCTGCITCVKMLMSGTKNMCVRSATRASPSSTASPASRAEGNPVREHKSPCGPRPVP